MTIPDRRLSALDAMRVSEGHRRLSLSAPYIVPPEYGVKEVTGGTVTHVAAQSAVRATVTTSDGSRAAFRTHEHFVADSPRVALLLYHSSAGQTNQTRRWGMFDDNDGVYFELSDTTLAVGWRSSVSGAAVDSNVVKASWTDPMDGSGDGPVLDITKVNLYEISLHQASGKVRFFINGYLVYTLDKRNTLAVPMVRTTRLPVGVDVENSGASVSASMTCLYAGVADESGETPQALSFGDAGTVTLSDSGVPILSLRPAATINSLENRMLLLPRFAVVGASAAGSIRFILDGTLTGASFAAVETDVSGAETDTSATAISSGSVVAEVRVAAGVPQFVDLQQVFNLLARKLKLKAFPNSDQDILSIVGVADSGTPTGYASLVWDEIR